jgi:hypothetical protein
MPLPIGYFLFLPPLSQVLILQRRPTHAGPILDALPVDLPSLSPRTGIHLAREIIAVVAPDYSIDSAFDMGILYTATFIEGSDI